MCCVDTNVIPGPRRQTVRPILGNNNNKIVSGLFFIFFSTVSPLRLWNSISGSNVEHMGLACMQNICFVFCSLCDLGKPIILRQRIVVLKNKLEDKFLHHGTSLETCCH